MAACPFVKFASRCENDFRTLFPGLIKVYPNVKFERAVQQKSSQDRKPIFAAKAESVGVQLARG